MPIPRRWITVKECAAYLSMHEVTVRRLIDSEKIPATRIGRTVRVDLKALTRKLEEKINGSVVF